MTEPIWYALVCSIALPAALVGLIVWAGKQGPPHLRGDGLKTTILLHLAAEGTGKTAMDIQRAIEPPNPSFRDLVPWAWRDRAIAELHRDGYILRSVDQDGRRTYAITPLGREALRG